MAENTVNWKDLFDPLKEVLEEGLQGLLEGAKEDLEEFVVDIAKDMAKAAAIGRKDLIHILVNQLEMVAERNRIQAVNAAWDTTARIVRVAGNFAVSIATKLI